MHPDYDQLAAYLDGALDEGERATLRAHILACQGCASRIERLREDARLISATLSARAVPDVRASVRARLRPRGPLTWLAPGGAFAGALAALLIFALLLGARSGATAGRLPDLLFVTDPEAGQLVALDASNGARIGAVTLGEGAMRVRYDERLDRLYVMLEQAIVAIDPQTLERIGRWEAPAPFGVGASMTLDARQGKLYVPQPNRIVALDTAMLIQAQSFALEQTPGPIALAGDGRTLYTLAGERAALWTIDLPTGSARLLDEGDTSRRGWLASDGEYLYMLRGSAQQGDRFDLGRSDRPRIWRLAARNGHLEGSLLIEALPMPWDILLLDADRLAIARGDGRVGGVELIDTRSLTVAARIQPQYDQHHLAAGPPGGFFALNWLHGTITRYDSASGAVVWRTGNERWQPWDGAFVPGGWRWPWEAIER